VEEVVEEVIKPIETVLRLRRESKRVLFYNKVLANSLAKGKGKA
jgi:hypothetical protein